MLKRCLSQHFMVHYSLNKIKLAFNAHLLIYLLTWWRWPQRPLALHQSQFYNTRKQTKCWKNTNKRKEIAQQPLALGSTTISFDSTLTNTSYSSDLQCTTPYRLSQAPVYTAKDHKYTTNSNKNDQFIQLIYIIYRAATN